MTDLLIGTYQYYIETINDYQWPIDYPIIQDNRNDFNQSVIYLNSCKSYITIQTIFPAYILYLHVHHYYHWLNVNKYLLVLLTNAMYSRNISKYLIYLYYGLYGCSGPALQSPFNLLYLYCNYIRIFENTNLQSLLSQYTMFIRLITTANYKPYTNYTIYSHTEYYTFS